jgi:hypothetical protein
MAIFKFVLVDYKQDVPNYRKEPKIPGILDKNAIHVLFLLIKLTTALAIQVYKLVYFGNKVK